MNGGKVADAADDVVIDVESPQPAQEDDQNAHDAQQNGEVVLIQHPETALEPQSNAAADDENCVNHSAATSGKRPKDRSKRSVAIHTGYVGTGYKGSSINRTLGDDVTIEQVLEKALFAAGCISEANFGSFSKINWTRASRTDKGVHSLGTVMGLRMLVDDRRYVAGPEGDCEGLEAAAGINQHLPPQIRVFSVQRTNKKFSARHMCEERVYQYYLPASMLDLKCDGGPEDATKLATFRDALSCFQGSHPYHNYTRRLVYQPGGSNVQYRPGRGTGKRPRDGSGGSTRGAPEDPTALIAGAGGGHANKAPANDEAAATCSIPIAAQVTDPSDFGSGGGGEGKAADEGPVVEGAAADVAAAVVAGVAPEGDSDLQPASKRMRVAEGDQRDKEGEAEAEGQAACVGGAGGGRGRGRGGRGRGEQQQPQGTPRRGGGGGEGSDDGDDEEDEEVGVGELDEEEEVAAEGEGEEGGARKAAECEGVCAGGRGRYGPDGRVVLLQWQKEIDPRDRVTQTYYRRIHHFTAEDPRPLVEGGTPCLLLEVRGQSFMLHHIRHMIGSAVAVTLGYIPKEVLLGSLLPPARVTLPRAPPHTLLLADCTFGRFPRQQGLGDNDLRNVTGERLSVRSGGVVAREAFRREVLLPALQQLVELPEWKQWQASLAACYPFPQEAIDAFLEPYRQWRERKEAQRTSRQQGWGAAAAEGAGEGPAGKEAAADGEAGEGFEGRHRGAGGGRRGRGRGRGGWGGGARRGRG